MSRNANETGVIDGVGAAVCEPVRESPPPSLPPSDELAPAGPELFERAREAVQAIRGRGRRANGQAGPGNTLALRDGLRSTQLLEQADVAAWHRERVAAMTTDQGGADEVSALKHGAIREAARLEVIAAALGDDLLHMGVLTGKGKTRAAAATYLQVVDRFMKLAHLIGIERTPKPTQTLQEYSAGPRYGTRDRRDGAMSDQHPRGRLRRVGAMWKPRPGGVSKTLGSGSVTVNGLRQRFAVFVNEHKQGDRDPDYVLLSSDEPERDEYAERTASPPPTRASQPTTSPAADGFVDPVSTLDADDIPF